MKVSRKFYLELTEYNGQQKGQNWHLKLIHRKCVHRWRKVQFDKDVVQSFCQFRQRCDLPGQFFDVWGHWPRSTDICDAQLWMRRLLGDSMMFRFTGFLYYLRCKTHQQPRKVREPEGGTFWLNKYNSTKITSIESSKYILNLKSYQISRFNLLSIKFKLGNSPMLGELAIKSGTPFAKTIFFVAIVINKISKNHKKDSNLI